MADVPYGKLLAEPGHTVRQQLPHVRTITDVEVTADGIALVVSTEGGEAAGVYLFDVRNPPDARPAAFLAMPSGVHTATTAMIDGRRYVFAAKNAPDPALVIIELLQ